MSDEVLTISNALQKGLCDMLMADIAREPTAPSCWEDMFPMIEQCSDKEFVKGYYKKKGEIKKW